MSQPYQLAQVNIARMLAPLDDPGMADFVAALDTINQLADESPGFIWRLQTDDGNATQVRAYEDDRILFNMSVWASLEALQQYVYRSQHGKVMAKRKQWFSKYEGPYQALWWIPAGHIPTVAEAKQRLEYLRQHGETPFAFTFKKNFSALEDN
jgi:heme-degrading monooxygenase HmoA